jgi:ribulose-phosphate 3-epimerase
LRHANRAMNGKILAPSILAYDSCRIADGVALIEKFHGHWVHVDVMDGLFVDNMAFGQCAVRDLRALTKLPLDVHLMVHRPERLVESFINAGADALTIHGEATVDATGTLNLIKNNGRMAGIAINPDTSVAAVENLLELCDIILIMGVYPGRCGQKFLPSACEKIRRLAAFRDAQRLNYKISVDGGINYETLPLAMDAGADIFVSGSAFFTDPERMGGYFSPPNG